MIAGDEMRFVTEKIGHGSRSMKPAQAEERVKGRLCGGGGCGQCGLVTRCGSGDP